jgi:ferredoxin-type protein NapH
MKRISIRTRRRAFQIGVSLAFIVIPFLNSRHINFLYGNFLAFHLAGLPLADPLAAIQVSLKNLYLPADLLIGGGIALAIAASLGTVFCSWVCPFGLLSEWAHRLSVRFFPVKLKEAANSRSGFALRVTIHALGVSCYFIFPTTPLLNQLSMPAWYSRIFQYLFIQNHISLAILVMLLVLLMELLLRTRIWCRFICPQSISLALARQINRSVLSVHYARAKCICKKEPVPCRKACSLSLDPRKRQRSPSDLCTNCGDCIDACAKMGGALSFRFRPPRRTQMGTGESGPPDN